MSMAGVPPSSADFAPSWLKFGNCKQLGNLSPKDNKRATSSSKVYSQPFASPETRHSNYFSNAVDKAWPQLADKKETGKLPEQSKWPSSSKDLRKKITPATPTCYTNFASVVNGPAKHASMNTDFPTLGKMRQLNMTKQSLNMWNKPLVLKSSDSVRNNSLKKTSSKTACDASSIYKSLVPKTSSANNKPPYRRTVSVPSGGSRHKNKEFDVAEKYSAMPICHDVKEKCQAKPTISNIPPTEDTSSIPGVKRHKKGKNVFLKELRQADKPTAETIENKTFAKTYEQRKSSIVTEDNLQSNSEKIPVHELIIVGMDTHDDVHRDQEMCNEVAANNSPKDWWEEVDASIPQDESSLSNPPLSSSLEAEHRLLRQMGWTECEEGANGDATGGDESPLTDAEIREFFLNYKKKGLISVPSPTHRETAFKDALSAWLLTGPPVLRRNQQLDKNVKTSLQPLSPCSVASSDYSNISSCGMESE